MHHLSFKRRFSLGVLLLCLMLHGGSAAYGAASTGKESTGTASSNGKESTGDASSTGEESIGTASAGKESTGAASSVRISWWICPLGGFSDEEAVEALTDAYEQINPGIEVEARILDEKTGAEEIEAALGTEDGPDVVLAAPEDIVTKWGSAGRMADLSALWDEETQREFRSEMKDVSRDRDGVWYGAALFRDLYTMAINYDMFEEADALQYLNEEAHSWKDNGFIDSVLRVHDTLAQSGAKSSVVGRVYCKDENGQRPFMCFVENFNKTGLVDEFRSSYQLGSGKIRSVFSTLKNLVGKGIEFDPEMDGEGENDAFLAGDLFMTFNWSAAKQKAALEGQARGERFRIFPMMYPNAKNVPTLSGPVRSLGVAEQENQEKKDAAMSFVRYLMTDEEAYTQAVRLSGCFPARRTLNGRELTTAELYGNDTVMDLYGTLNEYYEYYDPVMELFDQLEEAWPELVRRIADGEKVKSVLTEMEEELNEALVEQYGIHAIEMEEE